MTSNDGSSDSSPYMQTLDGTAFSRVLAATHFVSVLLLEELWRMTWDPMGWLNRIYSYQLITPALVRPNDRSSSSRIPG